MKIGMLAREDTISAPAAEYSAVYIKSVTQELIQMGQDVTWVCLDPPVQLSCPGVKVIGYRIGRLPVGHVMIRNWLINRVAGRFDVFHDMSGRLLPPGRNAGHKIITVNSVGPMEKPQCFRDHIVQEWRTIYPRRLEDADAVIVWSPLEKERLLRYYQVDEGKVFAVPPGLDIRRFKPPTADNVNPIGCPYILFVGSLAWRKGVIDLVRAFSIIREQVPHKLVLAGAEWFDETGLVIGEIERLNLGDRVVRNGPVPHDELPVYYAAADVTVHLSLYESYTMPPLEAMACGCPVVTSNEESMRRLYGKVTLQVDVGDFRGAAHCIIRVLSDATLRKHMISNGLAFARTLTWENTARKTLEVYETILRESSRAR